jgi:hypothetical protein
LTKRWTALVSLKSGLTHNIKSGFFGYRKKTRNKTIQGQMTTEQRATEFSLHRGLIPIKQRTTIERSWSRLTAKAPVRHANQQICAQSARVNLNCTAAG